MLEPLAKNQEQIAMLEMMDSHGQYARKAAVTMPHIMYGNDPMERLAQAEKECNEDLEKYSQYLNMHIHRTILLHATK